jgi:hypothetical protein
MYRIFCESYKNYIGMFTDDMKREEYRYVIALPLALLCDEARYAAEKESETKLYRQLSDLLFHMEQNTATYPAIKAFLWTLESRGISGTSYGIVTGAFLDEQVKLVIMLLKLMYWEETV